MRVLVCILLMLLCPAVASARPWVVAHRGAPSLGPENALATFEKACDLGVDAIELDIHQSRDGGLLVIHDDTLDRTYGRPGKVGEMTKSELVEVGVPTLQQALQVIRRRCQVLVEIKHPGDSRYQGIEERLLEVLRSEGRLQGVVVISFDSTSLRRLHELQPSLVTGWLVGIPVDPSRARRELGITYLAPHFSLVDQRLVREVRASGLKLGVWTVNREADLRRMVELGCDAITTDEPRRLMELLGPRP
ncbi:MAG: glycerophosphodiester phosphodiesterase [Candidatus Eremiobacterota bacterium]